MLQRIAENPIIKPSDLLPLHADFKILGVFNPAAFIFEKKICLLLRVAEQPIAVDGKCRIPFIDNSSGEAKMSFFELNSNDKDLDLSDVRKYRWKGQDYLSSLSHFRLAMSDDGIHFKTDNEPWLLPNGENENFGIEDARVTQIDESFYINFTAVSDDGYVTSLVKTNDFKTLSRLGIIFHPLNKDVAIFPEKINGLYYALHRPETMPFAKPAIWISSSPDLIHWGDYHVLLRPGKNQWNMLKIGGGPPPIKTSAGWLVIYHGVAPHPVDSSEVYSLSAMLLDINNPLKIIADLSPILIPETDYEKNAFVKNVVFSNGAIIHPLTQQLMVYYGAGDESIGVAAIPLQEIINQLA